MGNNFRFPDGSSGGNAPAGGSGQGNFNNDDEDDLYSYAENEYLQTPVHIYVLHKRRCIVHVTHENIIAYVLMHYNADSLVLKDQYGMKIQFEVSRKKKKKKKREKRRKRGKKGKKKKKG